MIPIGTEVRMPLPRDFLTKLHFEAFEIKGEIYIELLSELIVITRFGRFVIPQGFVSDGASIPYLARAIAGDPPAFDYLSQAIVHDALYRKGMFDHMSRAQADLIFRDLLWNSPDVPAWKTASFYSAVRAAGWRSFKKHSGITF